MPDLTQHSSVSIIRALNMGEPGSGKTGALASLVIAGYNLYILDFDNGLDIIVSALRHHYQTDPAGLHAALSRVKYETIRDEIIMVGGIPRIKAATAWKRAGEVLKSWEPDSLTARDVVCMDTLSTASGFALNQAQALGANLNKRVEQGEYGWMADSVFMFIDALTAETPFNVVVNTHVRYLHGQEDVAQNNRGQEVAAGAMRGLPQAKGQQIPREIGKYFNTVLLTQTIGKGPGAKRVISTRPQGIVEVKVSNPFGVKPLYPVDAGLAPLFADILGHPPAESPRPSPDTATN